MELIVWDGPFKFLNPARANLRLSLEPGELGIAGSIHLPHAALPILAVTE